MTIEPVDAAPDAAPSAAPPTPPPAAPAPTSPPAPTPVEPRNRRTTVIVASAITAVLVLAAAGFVGHGAWLLVDGFRSPPSATGGESSNPGHVQTMPDLSVEGLDVTPSSSREIVGVVTILTDLLYDDSSQAAGTGSVLTRDGKVLTNNHVIEGSTYIEVTIESTGDTYDAVVLGTDKTNDVALLQLIDAEGLDTVTLSDRKVEVGDTVASIGNAQGTGDLVTAEGRVTSTDESLSIGDGYGGEYENLTGLIEVDADVVSGDSGGPLVDDDGEVVGMVTAASVGGGDIRGYAIAIEFAMSVVEQIESGDESGTVNIGPTAFIGVTLAEDQGTTGITLNGAIDGTPGDKAGLGDGDIITSVDGEAVLTVDELKALLRTHEPGDVIEISYTDADGAAQSVEVKLTEGPA